MPASRQTASATTPQGLTISLVESLRRKERMPKAELEALAKKWQEENREAIESYNAYIEKYGVFGDDETRGF